MNREEVRKVLEELVKPLYHSDQTPTDNCSQCRDGIDSATDKIMAMGKLDEKKIIDIIMFTPVGESLAQAICSHFGVKKMSRERLVENLKEFFGVKNNREVL